MKPAPMLRDERWSCPCGCELVLSTGDSSAERRLLMHLGAYRPVSLALVPMTHGGSREPVEPSRAVRCRSCSNEFAFPAYLLDFIALHPAYAIAPSCEACR